MSKGRARSLTVTFLPQRRKDTVPRAKLFITKNDTNSEFNNSFEIEIYILVNDNILVSRVHNIRIIRSATIVADGSSLCPRSERKYLQRGMGRSILQSNKVALMAQKQTPSRKSCSTVDAKVPPNDQEEG